mmetsp:Transcript_39720/g.60879  ORF Transcript_39720/g.60879 Transcript_39720/m.60879 type:complete len:263 (+) Transcript_39720:1387-2175(+)
MSPSDVTPALIDKFITNLSVSPKFLEEKLFFILEHFDQLHITQLNHLIDTLSIGFHRSDIRRHMMVCQYNPVKLSLLIYRVSWLIERKKIYSLITKCSILNKYILNSLVRYLETFNNVAQLYRLMREPILSRGTSMDSLDAMLEMNLESILEHPIVVEVLNLVYEGQYSVDSSPLHLITTFSTFFFMDTFDIKRIGSRLTSNIINMGQVKGDRRQSSLQFNIWKYSLEQRQGDETILTVGVCLLMIVATLSILNVQSVFKGV